MSLSPKGPELDNCLATAWAQHRAGKAVPFPPPSTQTLLLLAVPSRGRKCCPAGPYGSKSSWSFMPSPTPSCTVKVQRFALHWTERRSFSTFNCVCIMGMGRGQDWKKSSLDANQSHLPLQRKLWKLPFVLLVHFIPYSSGLNFMKSSTRNCDLH